jgi:hypothetical protein
MDSKAKRHPAREKAPIKRIRHLLLRSVAGQPESAKAVTPGRPTIKSALAGPSLFALRLA